MSLELDHLFICTDVGAPEASRLADFGLTEGEPNTHPGQGTACRRFFFHNAYLELLWVCDADEARSERIRATRLWDRWAQRNDGVCPFGFAFRPIALHAGPLPFRTWEYRPPYLPETASIPIATNSDVLIEPMLFYMAFARRPDSYPAAKRPMIEHAAGLHRITSLELTIPSAETCSPELRQVSSVGLVRLRNGPEQLLTIGFDGELQRREADFRPAVPMVFRW
jgi:hypothetical protein